MTWGKKEVFSTLLLRKDNKDVQLWQEPDDDDKKRPQSCFSVCAMCEGASSHQCTSTVNPKKNSLQNISRRLIIRNYKPLKEII